MEAQVAAALEASDYQQVAKLLKQWHRNEPKSPLLRLYTAQWQERIHRLEAAEKNYLKLLKQTPGGKIMQQARAGIQRIQQQQSDQKAAALEPAKQPAKQPAKRPATQSAGGDEVAILAIAAPLETNRLQAIQGVAQVFNLDAYTARMKVPASGFRLHRVGPWGEISYYAQALKASKLPTLSAKVSHIQALSVFQICCFEALAPQPTVLCKSADGQLGNIRFDWSEVSVQVSAQLPIFEQVVDIGNWGKTIHKEKVQDYAQVMDLHLAGRKIVLRMCDRLYQYQQGITLTDRKELNSRIQWNQLLSQLAQAISATHHDDFNRFGQGALEFINLLPPVHPHLDIDRRAPSEWDIAFHLYSSLYSFPEAWR
ncbi:MAG: hypothetical protein HC800_05450 [Phormidesmis sp. RL_2_1]|nr:hypothetical protein [Phormidesmis sp. RL_2_1]